MKRRNNKLLTLMLAGLLCVATAGTVAASLPVKASADTTAKSYELTKVFNSNNTSSTIAGKDGKTELTMGNGHSVEFNRNLAIQWFSAKDTPEYTTLKFTFKDINFTEMDFVFKAAALHAAKDDVAVNTVKFIKDQEDKVSVKVFSGDEDVAKVEATATTVVAGSAIELQLAKGSQLGNYAVKLTVDGTAVDNTFEFTNIGAKYFNNGTINGKEVQSLVVETKAAADAKTVLIINEINGQLFSNTAENDKVISSDGLKVADTAAPVLVINEDIRGFLLGTQFELDYKEIDVLDESLTSKKTFYQYNPTNEKVAYAENGVDYATTITPNSTTGTYFMDTVVYANANGEFSKEAKEGFEQTTVYRVLKEEYVAIRFVLEDDTYTGKGEDKHLRAAYDLSWYADSEWVKTKTVGTEEKDYIILNRNEVGPHYLAYTAEDVANYEKRVQDKADEISAGSNSDVELPSLAWLIDDENNGYQTLQFTISYKTPSSSSAKTTSNVDPKSLKISATDAGWYEFKVFASDAAGNAMMVEDEDGELVKVTSSNVWDLDKIPSFRFGVAAKGVEVKSGEDSDTLDTEILGESFTMSSISISGATSQEEAYALYKLDLSKYDGEGNLTADTLSKIKFNALQIEAHALTKAALSDTAFSAIDYSEINKQAYINLVAKALGGDLETEKKAVEKIFVKAVKEYNNLITEEDETAWKNSDNKYNWQPSSRTFKAVESGLFLIVADFWDSEVPVGHAAAYQLVDVASEADVIKGETEWLKNNLVSVILFSVAGVMLILIIILLLVKPSEETLEDVDEKLVSKRKEATDKHKNK